MTNATELRIPHLNQLERADLEKAFEQAGARQDVTFGHEDLTGARYGDPFTVTAIVIVSVTALKVLASWLAKSRHQKTIEQTFEVVRKDGTREKRTVRISGQDEASASSSVYEQMAKLFGDTPTLAGAKQSNGAKSTAKK